MSAASMSGAGAIVQRIQAFASGVIRQGVAHRRDPG
jgi:hypothetical protein